MIRNFGVNREKINIKVYIKCINFTQSFLLKSTRALKHFWAVYN